MGDSQRVVCILGAGLAGSEAALQLADRGIRVELVEMRPEVGTAVHKTGNAAELVCSNSLKSTNPDSAAGMLKAELSALGSHLIDAAMRNRVAAGGALAVDRDAFSGEVTARLCAHPCIEISRRLARSLDEEAVGVDALIVATGPLTEGDLAQSLCEATGADNLAFFDAAAPVVMAESLDREKLFSQSRYEEGAGDYLNAPFSKEEYEAFAQELVGAERVIKREFESKDLFQACQPIEEIARTGIDAPRFGALKPVGLTDPRTGRRPWAALQLRAEDAHGESYNLVGFQTNLTWPEQRRVFRMIPGLEECEFFRYGVMHRNTFIDAPACLDETFALKGDRRIRFAGQITGTEGYTEAIATGLLAAFNTLADLRGLALSPLPVTGALGSLMAYATDPATKDYQPMHVNFGIVPPLDHKGKLSKRDKYKLYAKRAAADLDAWCAANASVVDIDPEAHTELVWGDDGR